LVAISTRLIGLVALQGATTKISNSCAPCEADQALTTAPPRLGGNQKRHPKVYTFKRRVQSSYEEFR
jgi:hypothetical protein